MIPSWTMFSIGYGFPSSTMLLLINMVLISLPIFSTEITKELCECSFPKCSCLNQNVKAVESVAKKYCSAQVNELDISFNYFAEINTNGGFSVGACDGLSKLRLRDNNINYLKPKDFIGLPNLQLLDLGNNNLTYYGENSFVNLSFSLNSLILDHNPVRVIAKKDFSQLYELKYLNLASNRIGYVAEDSFKNCCSQLETFILAENYLTSLEAKMFAGLRQLKVLDLSFNPICRITNSTFADLVNLKNLTITYRKQINFTSITELQSNAFNSLMNLEVLTIQDMRIFTLHAGIFAGLSTHLRHLNLSFNHILNFSSDTFENLAALETLSLRGNRLSCIPNQAFQHQSHLVSLDLALNQITYLHYQAFTALRSLQVLDIHGNPLRRVHMELACPMTRLQTVIIDTRIHQFTFDSEKTLLSLFSPNTSIHVAVDSNYFLAKAAPTSLRGERVSCAKVKVDSAAISMNKTWNISDLASCPFFLSYEASYETQAGSRIYLLIIIAICISFLLLAFIVILSYRAWSKRKMLYEEVQTVEMQPLEPDTVNAIKQGGKEEVTKVMINGTPTQSSPVPTDIVVRTTSLPNAPKDGETTARPASNGLTTGQLVPGRSSTDDDSDTIIALGVV